jgi:hypothetical protein
MSAAKLRWTVAGRELRLHDPKRFAALLGLAEEIVRVHRRRSSREKLPRSFHLAKAKGPTLAGGGRGAP